MPALPRTRLTLEPLEDRVLLSAAPSIQMTFATTPDSRTLSVNYTIAGADFTGQPLAFNVYRSPNYNSLTGAQLLGTASLPVGDAADLGVGSHQGVKLTLTGTNGQALTALTPNPTMPFLVVAANPSAGISASNVASFQTHVLGVIAHGSEFDPRLWLTNSPPAWETQMAALLQQRDGYEAVLPFAWAFGSILPLPGVVELAGNQLFQQVVAKADQLAAAHPGDVVDVQFIGHSRGAVVVSEALQDLAGVNDPALRGGFMQMTLLDPHPANLQLASFSFNPFRPLSALLADAAIVFESLARDPQVVVPANVLQAQDFDQQTLVGAPFAALSELFLNLWGEAPAALPSQSSQPIRSMNLTNVNAPGIGPIGHDEVHEWYQANVINTGETFSYFG